MVKWGVPEKILQNVVQTRCSKVIRTLQSKVMTKSNLWAISPLLWQYKTSDGWPWPWIVYGSINLKLSMQSNFALRNAHAEDYGRNPKKFCFSLPSIQSLFPALLGHLSINQHPSKTDIYPYNLSDVEHNLSDIWFMPVIESRPGELEIW